MNLVFIYQSDIKYKVMIICLHVHNIIKIKRLAMNFDDTAFHDK